MTSRAQRFVLLSWAIAVLSLSSAGAAAPLQLARTELFPIAPGVDTQRGFAVAVDGDWMAVGAPLEKGDGAVHLFLWNGDASRWDLKATLFPSPPPGPPGTPAHFGNAVALRDGILAVAALGEGAVYVFQNGGGGWVQLTRLSGRPDSPGQLGTPGVPGRFGRAVALASTPGIIRLAVGEVAAHGEVKGTVWVYTFTVASGWTFYGGTVRRTGDTAPGNRLGQALALSADGATLAVGDPADQGSAGAVHLFAVITGQSPKPLQMLTAPGGAAGDQFGAAVALSGDLLAVGAPTADRVGRNAGAVFTFRRTGGDWSPITGPQAADPLPGDQLGAAIALDGDLLVAGAPAPGALDPVTHERRLGAVHVFRFDAGTWSAVAPLQPGNAEPGDLTGFAVAVSGGRVAVGAVLGDQGGNAAGAAWTFSCGEGCAEEAEAMVRDDSAGHRAGAAVALSSDGHFLAVGVSLGVDDVTTDRGAAYVYRRAGTGWRQESRLFSPQQVTGDGFASAVALDGETLAVGAPDVGEVPPDALGGLVYMFHRVGTAWQSEETPVGLGQNPGGDFGATLALAGDILAVGAPDRGAGAVFVYRRTETGWVSFPLVTPATGSSGDHFGASIALRDGMLAVGAPSAAAPVIFIPRPARFVSPPVSSPPGGGAVYVFSLQADAWVPSARLQLPLTDLTPLHGAFGAAVSLGDGTLAVGAPGLAPDAGSVYLFSGPSWLQQGAAIFPLVPSDRFGTAVVLRGGSLLVGAPGTGKVLKPSGQVFLFRRDGAAWTQSAVVSAVPRVNGDKFGTSLGFEGGAFVVTSPSQSSGEWVTVFTTDVTP